MLRPSPAGIVEEVRWFVLGIVLVVAGGCDKLLSLQMVGTAGDAGQRPLDYVGGKAVANASHDTTVSVTFDAPAVQGDMIIVSLGTYRATVTDITDTAKNPYHVTSSSPVESPMCAVWIALAPVLATADPFTVTATVIPSGTSPVEVTLAADEYSGLQAATSPETAASNSGAAAPTCGEVVTTGGGELVFAAIVVDGGGAVTAGPGFMLRHDPTTANTTTTPIAIEDALVTQGQTLTPAFSLANLSGWGCSTIVVQ